MRALCSSFGLAASVVAVVACQGASSADDPGTRNPPGVSMTIAAPPADASTSTPDVAPDAGASARSCTGGPGANHACNGGLDDCCESIAVPGGSFANHDGTTVSTTTVAAFALDKFELTVGRLRAYYTSVGGSPRDHAPPGGAGAHPLIADSGWRASWDVRLPGSWSEIDARMTTECAVGGNNAQWGEATWTAQPGANEDKPANCIDWYTLFAFAIWDGGRLPTDAEWSYVAYSGAEQRAFPWGNDAAIFETHKMAVATSFLVPGETYGRYTVGPTYAAIDDGPAHIAQVGTKTERSKWGHADMGGNVMELVLDAPRALPASCTNCANVVFPEPPQNAAVQPLSWQPLGADGLPPASDTPDDFLDARAIQDGKRFARGGSWMGEYEGHFSANEANRFEAPVWRTYGAIGARIARDR